jgi:hypothetical protein
MNLRKNFNLPSKQQKALLDADRENVLSKCNNIARKEREDMYREQKNHDEICPNCKTKKSDNRNNIVNNIRRVQGEGHVGGSFSLGFGSVNGSISIDTHAVNHCNVCGNEWEKFKTKSVSETNILRVCLNYLAELISNPVYHKQFSWKMEAILAFEDAYAETIYKLSQKEGDYLWLSTKSTLSLSRLRRYYKSIYDGNNKKELEKI